MKVQVPLADLTAALMLAEGAAASKSPQPLLEMVQIAASKDGQVRLAATNLIVSMELWLGGDVDEAGGVGLSGPARLWLDTVNRSQKRGATRTVLTIDAMKTQAKMTAAGRSITVPVMDLKDAPTFPAPDLNRALGVMSTQQLKDLLSVSFAAATDDTRPVLKGICLRQSNGRLEAVAADGFQAARRIVGTQGTEEQMVVIHAESAETVLTLQEWTGGLDAALYLSTNANALVVVFGDPANPIARWSTRVIDGKFPDVSRAIPTQWQGQALVNRHELQAAINEVSAPARQASGPVFVRLTLEDQQMVLETNVPEVGRCTSPVALERPAALMDGSQKQVVVNLAFLKEQVRAIPTDLAMVEMQSPIHPLVITPVNLPTGEMVTILMPINNR